MPDKRLIDANALLEKLGERYLATDPSDPEQLGYLYSRVIVRNEPTIDAVEVVRCKDCVHAIVFRTGSVSCRYHDWYRISVDPDGYCNHGEKDIDDPIEDGGAEC